MLIKPGALNNSSHKMVPKITQFFLIKCRCWSGKNAGKAGDKVRELTEN